MLWHIELKFCIWLCFIVLQTKFECRQFASMFVGVMPPLELRILQIHSFPHFSLACFDILSWNFAYDFVLSYYISSSSFINLRLCLWELCPFWNLEYWKYTVFRTFLLHALTYWAELEIHSFPHFSLACFDILSWNFTYDFVSPYYRSSSSVVNLHQFFKSNAPFGT